MKFEPVTLTYYRNGEDPDLAETHSHHKSEWDLLLFLLVEFGNGDPIDYFENGKNYSEISPYVNPISSKK